ncbi:MAG: hypothetical protein SF066_02175 [Thermoanaerobaculia bacterium]|nr:hypothetical protein [Thermoanaerobaculia bacterium]
MKPRFSLLVVLSLLVLGASVAVAADETSSLTASVSEPADDPFTPESSSGCGTTEASDLFLPEPQLLATGTCGSCSLNPCKGAVVGQRCKTNPINGVWAWCIPATTELCPTGPQNTTNWACRCALEYF